MLRRSKQRTRADAVAKPFLGLSIEFFFQNGCGYFFGALNYMNWITMLRHATGYALANEGTDTRLIRTSWDMPRSQTRCATRSWREGAWRLYG
jgi:hypothetical protein